MNIVIDTNILVNAFRNGGNSHSKSVRLIKDVYTGKHEVYYSLEILSEYNEVLQRKELKINRFARTQWLKWIRKNGICIEPSPSTSRNYEMSDENDRKFFDVAKCVNARLITRNLKHFPIHEIRTSIDELY